MKPLLSNTVVSSNITFVEDNINDLDNNKNFLSNIKNLGLYQYNKTEPSRQNVNDLLIKTVVRCRFHPSINVIKEKRISNFCFSFPQIEQDE